MQPSALVHEDLDWEGGCDAPHYLVARHRGEGLPEGVFERAQYLSGVSSLLPVIPLVLRARRVHGFMLPLVATSATGLSRRETRRHGTRYSQPGCQSRAIGRGLGMICQSSDNVRSGTHDAIASKSASQWTTVASRRMPTAAIRQSAMLLMVLPPVRASRKIAAASW